MARSLRRRQRAAGPCEHAAGCWRARCCASRSRRRSRSRVAGERSARLPSARTAAGASAAHAVIAPSALPLAALGPVSAVLGDADAAYGVERSHGAFRASNPGAKAGDPLFELGRPAQRTRARRRAEPAGGRLRQRVAGRRRSRRCARAAIVRSMSGVGSRSPTPTGRRVSSRLSRCRARCRDTEQGALTLAMTLSGTRPRVAGCDWAEHRAGGRGRVVAALRRVARDRRPRARSAQLAAARRARAADQGRHARAHATRCGSTR